MNSLFCGMPNWLQTTIVIIALIFAVGMLISLFWIIAAMGSDGIAREYVAIPVCWYIASIVYFLTLVGVMHDPHQRIS